MPITREYLKNPNLPEEERVQLQAKLDRCMANDEWANKIFKKLAVLVISYPGQRAYLKASIESLSKLGYFIAFTYDNYVDPKEDSVDHNFYMPDKEILDKIDLFILPHHQTWKDVNYPYFWGAKWGANALQGFDYIFVTEGDFVLDKPEGFEQLFSLIGDGDIMTCGPDNDLEISSGAYIVKSKVFLQLVQYMQDRFIPFEKYEQYQELTGAESRIRAAIRELNLKMISVPGEPTPDCTHDLKGTWYDLVGLRHIQGELDYAFKKGLIPPHYKYIEEKYLQEIYNYKLVKEYWDTMDMNVLKNWWHK
jgi:hypothetical protein